MIPHLSSPRGRRSAFRRRADDGNVAAVSQRLTFLTFTYRDFTFIILVVSIFVDTCIAGPVRVVVGPALNTVM